MAIDTAAKRRSAAGIGLQLAPSVTPDSNKDGPWRQTAAWSYYGIAAGAVVDIATDYAWTGYVLTDHAVTEYIRTDHASTEYVVTDHDSDEVI